MGDYRTDMQTYNRGWEEVLAEVQDLPESGGMGLPTLTNPATPGDVVSGKEYINQDGTVGVGTLTVDTSGSGSAPTCTVVGADYGSYGTEPGTVYYQTATGYRHSDWGPGVQLAGVLLNSFLSFRVSGSANAVDGGTLLEVNGKELLVGISGTAGETVTIDLYS